MPGHGAVRRLRRLLAFFGDAWSSHGRKVMVDDRAIVELRGSFRTRICWSDVVRIDAWSADMATYDETFVRILGFDGADITIGELDECFGSFLARLDQRLSPVSAGWMDHLDRSGPGSTILVYSTDKKY